MTVNTAKPRKPSSQGRCPRRKVGLSLHEVEQTSHSLSLGSFVVSIGLVLCCIHPSGRNIVVRRLGKSSLGHTAWYCMFWFLQSRREFSTGQTPEALNPSCRGLG